MEHTKKEIIKSVIDELDECLNDYNIDSMDRSNVINVDLKNKL